MSVTGEFPDGGVVISNHVSYLDIIVFAALKPCVFVSKAEIAQWPVLGWMTTMAGTVYVNRGHGGSAAEGARGNDRRLRMPDCRWCSFRRGRPRMGVRC